MATKTAAKGRPFAYTKDALRAEVIDEQLADSGQKRGVDYIVLYPWAAGNGLYKFFKPGQTPTKDK